MISEARPIPRAPANRLALLIDQHARWRRGDPAPVEAYLRDWPALLEETEFVLDLIYHEVLLRESSGERPEAIEYSRRFPSLAHQINAQLFIHRFFHHIDLLDICK